MSFYAGGMHKQHKYTKSNKDNHGSAGFKETENTVQNINVIHKQMALIYLFSESVFRY